MSEPKQHDSSNFQSKDQAFEYLVKESQNKALKEQWKKQLDELPDAPPHERTSSKRILLRRIISVAATVVLLLGSFFWFSESQNSIEQMASRMIDETNIVLESATYTRGVNDDTEDEMTKSLKKEISKALEKQDYNAAVGLFMTKEKQSQLSLDDKFYYSLALSRNKNGDYFKAIRLLDDVISDKNKYYNESLWLQALLYLKTGAPIKAKVRLNNLIDNSNYQNVNAKSLIDKINS